ncbi:hypothetical protein Daus18300_000870 [Diaporthe australafricana]|uniref:Uncharacterized protein n=1 Tax=Diaporthe australafricana TaxID=127596 RepID=A0ABR3Y1X7_9PEZI
MSQDETKIDGTDATTQPTYKEQLDEAAIKVKDPQNDANKGGVIEQVVEKVSQYVPAVGKVLGTDQKGDESSQNETKVPGPPERPHHDTQIEEFIKDQHRSKTDDGKLV